MSRPTLVRIHQQHPHNLQKALKEEIETLQRGILLWQESQPGDSLLFTGRNSPQSDGLLQSLRGLTLPAVICFLQETRLKEGIVRLQPQEEPLRSELLSGKFTVLVRTSFEPPPRLVFALKGSSLMLDYTEIKG